MTSSTELTIIEFFMLHTTRNPAVHPEIYKEPAQNTGTADYLYQRIISGFDHCMPTEDPTDMQFNLAVITAFGNPVKWVDYGIMPTQVPGSFFM